MSDQAGFWGVIMGFLAPFRRYSPAQYAGYRTKRPAFLLSLLLTFCLAAGTSYAQYNPATTDSDGDGIVDSLDLDDDNDGILDTVENALCILTPNPGDGYYIATSAVVNSPQLTSLQAWVSASKTTSTFTGMMFSNPSRIFLVTTKGRGGGDEWVTSYKLQGTKDGTNWIDIGTYTGNTDRNTSVTNQISNTDTDWIGVRINPQTWFNNPSLRFEVNACGPGIYDIDSDGIPNNLDLDSDGDGCPDAVEGNANFKVANLVSSTMAGGSTNESRNLPTPVGSTTATLGVPTIAGTGQSIGSSQNAVLSGCVDRDGDGIADPADLDDDNDGILDTVERSTCAITPEPNSPNYINTGSAGGNAGNPQLTSSTGWGPTTANNTQYVGMIFTSPSRIFSITTRGRGDVVQWVTSYKLQGTKDGTNWIDLGTYPANTDQNTSVTNQVSSTDTDWIGVRINPQTWSGGSPGLRFEIGACPASVFDLDSDGLINQLDLDADGDGCADAIEGGGTFTQAQLVSSTMAGGNNGPNYTGASSQPVTQNLGTNVSSVTATLGVPLTTGSGQSLGNSQDAATNECITSVLDTDGDGIVNSIDLDDDNDGIPDTVEDQQENYIFNTGADQTFVVPCGMTKLTVKLWGAGGGGGVSYTNAGGGGGFATATIPVTPGETLTFIVGSSGRTLSATTTYGGGGAGGADPNNPFTGASGGGRTEIRRGNTSLLIAGGGGGAGGATNLLTSGLSFGGGGGGLQGLNALPTPSLATNGGGKGGTQTAGGAGGQANGVASSFNGLPGTQYQGGAGGPSQGGNSGGGGGGGGGWYGGGGGSGYGTEPSQESAGGGGSGYAAPSLTNVSLVAGQTGSLAIGPGLAAMRTDPNYLAEIGNGGAVTKNGGSGLIYLVLNDLDGDGILNSLDTDSDGDGCPDAVEAGLTQNLNQATMPAPYGNNGLSNSIESTDTQSATVVNAPRYSAVRYTRNALDCRINGCTDYDGDGIADLDDLDDDNDGILDTNECAPSNLVANGTFTTNLGSWTVTGGWVSNGRAFNSANSAVKQSLKQSISGLNTANASGYLTLGFDLFLGNVSNTMVRLDVSLGGTYYGQFQLQGGEIGFAGLNGATVTGITNFSTVVSSTLSNTAVQIVIPWSNKPNVADLDFQFSSDQSELSIDNVNIQSTICDMDGDGIANHFDLDSDGDGCPDAIEGGAIFTTANLVSSTLAGGSTNITKNLGTNVSSATATYGVPTIAGTGQTTGYSQLSAINGCIDADNDGVADIDDLDDDNDGIRDTDEDFANCANLYNWVSWTSITSTSATGILSYNGKSVTVTVNKPTGGLTSNGAMFGGSTFPTQYRVPTASLALGVNIAGLISVSFSSPLNVPLLAFASLGAPSVSLAVGLSPAYTVEWNGQATTYNSTTQLTGAEGYGIVGFPVSSSLSLNFSINENRTDFNFGVKDVAACLTPADIDGDGIINSLDLDSDGDGCADAIEGGANFTTTNLVSTTMAGGSTNVTANLGTSVGSGTATMGIPTIAGTGQSVLYSQNDTVNACTDTDGDGVADIDDLDDDNDGILDLAECGFAFITNPSGTTATPTIKVCYNSDAYGLNGTYMGLNDDKLLNPVNFGPNGIYKVNFQLVPIAPANITETNLNAQGCQIFQVGMDNTDAASGTTFTSLTNAQKLELKAWSSSAIDHMVLGFQGLAATWNSYVGSTGVTGQMLNTDLGAPLYNGPFGNATGFNQGGGYQGKFSSLPSGAYCSLITDQAGNVIAFVDKATQDIFFADVDILSTLGGMTANNTITSNNDQIFANLYALMAQTIVKQKPLLCDYLQECAIDLDGDGIVNSLDLDADGDGCADAVEGGAAFTTANLVSSTMAGGSTNVKLNLPTPVGSSTTTIGIPTLAGTGQTVGISQNSAVNGCTDTDGDGIADIDDLDDDNDGILDTAENVGLVQNGDFSSTSSWSITQNGAISAGIATISGGQLAMTADMSAAGGNTVFTQPIAGCWAPAKSVALDIRWIDGGASPTSFKVQIGNTVYGELLTSTANVGTFNYTNGASGTLTTLPPSTSLTNWVINLPAAAPTGLLTFVFAPKGTGPADDVYVDNVVTGSLDTDCDGIANSLDLDSDGDGCPDAIEGGAAFTTANLVSSTLAGGSTNVKTNLGNTVGSTTATLGVPTIAGTGQTTGTSQNAGVQDAACPQPDADGDGVPDSTDLDDDNDGILDTVEDPACQKVANGSGQNNLAGWTVTGNVVSNTNPQIIFNYNETPANGVLSQAISTVPNQPLQVKFDMVGFGSNTAGNASIRVDVLTGNTVIATKTITKAYGNPFTNETLSFLPFTNQTTIRFTDLSTVTSQFDLIISGISVVGACGLDSDGDGIINSLDLDSDGDGCADAIEGGAAFTTSNLVSSTLAGGSTNVTKNLPTPVGSTTATNGVPTIAGTGQTVGYSQNSSLNECIDTDGDGVADINDLDDDNDGILDVAEVPCVELIQNGVFPTTGGSVDVLAGWTVGGTYSANYPSTYGRVAFVADGLYFLRDNVTSFISQPISGIYPGGTITLNGLAWQNTSSVSDPAGQSVLEVKYNGVTYATVNTGLLNSPTIVGNNGATVNITSLPGVILGAVSAKSNLVITLPTGVPPSGVFQLLFTGGPSPGLADDIAIQSVSSLSCVNADADNDGIINSLDLDSDGDGCPDAIEGGAAFTTSNLVSSTMAGGNSGAGYTGTSTSPVTQNLGNTVGSTTATMGVPTIAGIGQTIGTSQDKLTQDPACCPVNGIAPTLTATSKGNLCPVTMVDLSTITATNTPASSTLTWHSGTPATAANRITNVTSVSAGTYYAAFFNTTANCYSGTAVTPVTASTVACCQVGTTAPTLSATTKINTCPATTIDLSTITASNTPAGTTLSWHSGTPATAANKLSSVTSLSAGTYYAGFYDAVANCYSGAAVTPVTATTVACCKVGALAPALSAQQITNACPATTIDLSTITSSNTPLGTSLTWHSASPATAANRITTITSVTAGIYYAAFYDAAANCYSNFATTAVFASTVACCQSGTVAPALSATSKTNVCPATTIDLSTITASNTPVGAVLSWHTGTPATAANRITAITAVPPGTYYAAFFDATNNCFSGAGSAVTPVTASTVACCPNPSVGGSLTLVGTLPLCSVSNQGVLTLSGQTGAVVKWQTSTNGGISWTDIAGTAGLTQYSFTNAQNNQQFRAVVNAGGSCSDANSTPFATPTSASACSADCDVQPGDIKK